MSLSYIRDYYGVPAQRGRRILFRGVPYRITGAQDAYLTARSLDGSDRKVLLHPTWEVEYIDLADGGDS